MVSLVGFSSLFYGVPDVLAGAAIVGSNGFESLVGYVGIFALCRGLMTISGGGLADPSSTSYKLFYGAGDFALAAVLFPSEFAWFFVLRGIASAIGVVL